MGNQMFTLSKLVVATALMLPPSLGAADAVEISHNSKFTIAYLGVNIGVMKHLVKLNGDSYQFSGSAKANSVVSIISDAKASFSSVGQIAGSRLIPTQHNLKYRSGKKSGRLKMGYTPNGVRSIEAKPKIRYKSGTVPLEKAHLRNVLDPVSSLLFPVSVADIGNGRRVCNRIVPIFDGRARINLVFSYKAANSEKVAGFEGKTFTCSVRYQPVSGIRPHKKNIKFMKANRDMHVTLARIGDSNIYTLFGFRVRTSNGMASGSAYEFSSR